MGGHKADFLRYGGRAPVSHASEDALLFLPPLARVLSFLPSISVTDLRVLSTRLRCLVCFASTGVNTPATKLPSRKCSGLLKRPALFVLTDFRVFCCVSAASSALKRLVCSPESSKIPGVPKDKKTIRFVGVLCCRTPVFQVHLVG